MIRISIAEQMLYHRNQCGVWHMYPISTASKGAGNQSNSWQTPLGRHRIYAKIGANTPIYTVFKAREAAGLFQNGIDADDKDWILSRILWLEGCQTGINKRGMVDTRSRYIYIHGTHAEELLGTPASHGCIRMSNQDVIHLFEHCKQGESIIIQA